MSYAYFEFFCKQGPWTVETWVLLHSASMNLREMEKVFSFFETKELGFNFHCLRCFLESSLESLAHFYLAKCVKSIAGGVTVKDAGGRVHLSITPHPKPQAEPSAVCWNNGLPVGHSSPAKSECHQSSDLQPQGCKGGEKSQCNTSIHIPIFTGTLRCPYTALHSSLFTKGECQMLSLVMAMGPLSCHSTAERDNAAL